jgi:hypothetical protein
MGGPARSDTNADSDGAAQAPFRDTAEQAGLPARLRAAFEEHTGPAERTLLVAWAGFAGTFGLTRALTTWIHAGHGPKGGGMSVGGRHFHHYNIGIALLGLVGGIALRGRDHHRRHPLTSAAYGSGAALIVDEAALLVDLQDVYWAQDGRKSVDVAIGIIAAGGAYLAAVPFWNVVTKEVLRSRPRSR